MSYSEPTKQVLQLATPAGKLRIKEQGSAVWRDVGEVSASTLTIASEKIEYKTGRCAEHELVESKVSSVTRTLTLAIESITGENLRYFLSAALGTVTQSLAAGETDDIALEKDRYADVGRTVLNPTGDNLITVNSITHKAGDAASAWAATTAYAVGDVVIPTTPNLHAYVCTVAGTSDGTEPVTWPTDGTTVVDATVTWQDVGTIILDATATTGDYIVDSEHGKIYIREDVNMIDGQVYTIDYDRAASTRQQLISGGSTITVGMEIEGCYDPLNASRHTLMNKCSIEPSGDLPLITNESSFMSLGINVSILKPDDGTAAVYMDGVPVAT